MGEILDGKKVSETIFEAVKKEVAKLENGLKPKLAVILVGDDPASKIYVNIKQKRAFELGFDTVDFKLPKTANEDEILKIISQLNEDKSVNAILVQLPLPETVDKMKILNAIDPKKDVDGFHYENAGKLYLTQTPYSIPCTARGILALLDYYNIDVEGKNVVVVGRSNIVGAPTARLLQNKNATVTICHSKTKNIEEYTKKADIIVCAVGKPKFLTADMVKDGAVVVDVGINKVETPGGKYKITGDTDFENIINKAAFITPVPKGVGPMTISGLMLNTLDLFKAQNGIN